MSNLEEKQLERREIYNGKIIHLVCDKVLLPNGDEAPREVCMAIDAVAIIPILDDGRVIMERQYRYPQGRVMLEIPAGKLNEPGEDTLEAAKRELREETGAIAERYVCLGKTVPSAAMLTEKITIYLAEGITFTDRELDDDEFLDVEFIPLDKLYEMVMAGEICDSKTEIAVLKAYAIKNSGKTFPET